MAEDAQELIGIVKRQTDYTEKTIVEKLAQHENNIEKIILEYNGVSANEPHCKHTTTNQKIFKAIRDNMNNINESSTIRKSKKQ